VRTVRLKSVQTNSGFLEQCKVSFAPRLTCIIGARGTCKSTLVESIRFAFNSDLDRISLLTSADGMITKTLGAGSVRCAVEVEEDGQAVEYTIDREIDGEPRVFRNGARDALGGDLLHEIEIYSQEALQQIASTDKPQLRLQLIDRPNRTEILRARQEIGKRVNELKNLGSRLRTMRGELDKRKLEIRDIDHLRAELGQAIDDRPELPPTLEEQHSLYVQRQRLLETLSEVEAVQRKVLSDVTIVSANRDKLIAARTALELPSNIELRVARELVDQLDTAIESIGRNSESIAGVPIRDEVRRLAVQFEKENEPYYQLRQQQQVLSESLKREDAVRRRVLDLEKIEREVKQQEAEWNELVRRRRTLRAEVAQMRDVIFEMRVRETETINLEFGDVILLAVRRAAHSRPFVSRLSELLAGSRIRTQGNIAEELAASLSPDDLLQIIEDSDAQRLASLLSRDLGQITRVIMYLRDHPELYDLEGELFDDSLEITMFDHGQPKPVEELSGGQRATALLPLILRRSSCPLIVDQPEDDLDNSFIFEVLVKTILKLKTERQLVFVTHNANIPVLGDAEEIVVMRMDRPTKAAPAQIGSLDDRKEDILHLLEGGKEAFEYREESYRSLLK
jgi:ABC-type Mn2+/Zn2+ transport system ATPase subunit